MSEERDQYWIVKWGEHVRGPYAKHLKAADACKEAFGLAAANMLVKPLGPRKSVFMGGKLGQFIHDPKNWEFVPLEQLDKSSRASRTMWRIENGRAVEVRPRQGHSTDGLARADGAPTAEAEAAAALSVSGGADEAVGLKPYVVAAINEHALRIGKTAAEQPQERATRQMKLLAGLKLKSDEDVRRALTDMPADSAAAMEVFFILAGTQPV